MLSRPLRSLALVLLAALGQSSVGWAAAPSPLTADDLNRGRLNRELAELVQTPGGPPGAIAVLRDGDRVEAFRAGVADLAGPAARPPQADDHVRLASVSKAYSGAVALALVDQGRLSLDDTIAQRLPDLPAAWGAVTLRQLLNHTSGLPDYPGSPDFQAVLKADPHHIFDPHCLLAYVADQPLAFIPGTEYHYANSDNVAVALMAEAGTGQHYEDLLRTLVLDPLDLHATSLPRGFRIPEPYLHGYAVDPPAGPEDVSTVYGMSGLWAAGGMISTPRELSAFTAAYAGGRLISPATRAQQLTFVPGRSQPSGPGRNEAGPGDLPLHHPVRRRLWPHGQLPRLHPAHRRHPRRPSQPRLRRLRAAQRRRATGAGGQAPRGPGGLRLPPVGYCLSRAANPQRS